MTDANYDAMLAAIAARDAIVRTEAERKAGPRKTQLRKALALPIPDYIAPSHPPTTPAPTHPPATPPPTPPPTHPPITPPPPTPSEESGLVIVRLVDYRPNLNGRDLDADAISRAIQDGLRGRQGALVLPPSTVGTILDRAPRYFPANVRVRGSGSRVLRSTDVLHGTFWSVKRASGRFTIDGQHRQGPWQVMPCELEIGAPSVELYEFGILNYLGMAVSCGEDNCLIRNFVIQGNGSTGCTNAEFGQATWGGIWSGNGLRNLTIQDGDVANVGGGSVFMSAKRGSILRVKSVDNCLGYTIDMNDPNQRYGGGQLVTAEPAEDILIQWCYASSRGEWASGGEINGFRVRILDSQFVNHIHHHGMVWQHGSGHEMAGCDITGNLHGMLVNPVVSDYAISQQERIKDNLQSNLTDLGRGRRA